MDKREFLDEHIFVVQGKVPWCAHIVKYLVSSTFHPSYLRNQCQRLKLESKYCVTDDPYLWKIGPEQVLRRRVPGNENELCLNFVINKHVVATFVCGT